ncbi:hypothetical protein [Myroides guanonis]|uniref:DUF1579 domain-containing protein n=1 Tax=Myroides guanonis TaxID=1150112 RepID=A0A1I3UYU2_9FLAO|nr:hypothetical protein [Myroides guanonis]SFJ88050.1 hypothetical protein SAMN04487893_1217 [Myroides guanonis]
MKKIEKSVFNRLIGVWETRGTILRDNINSKLVGIDSYEFILEGNYILHKANVIMGDIKSETFEIIELDNSFEQGKMYYYNSNGEKGLMRASLYEDAFIIKGDNLKFEGSLKEEDTLLIGKWYLLSKDDEWIEFIDLKLTKFGV